MVHLTDLSRPFIVGVVTEQTTDAARASITAAVQEGADAIEVNLAALGEVSIESFRTLTTPEVVVYTTARRPEFMQVYGIDAASCPRWTEEERMAQQLRLLAAGSAAIDMELDTFDPHPSPPLGTPEADRAAVTFGPPMELSHSSVAIARQRETAARARELGGEVIVSCHTGRRQTTEQLIEVVRTARERGADLVKVVSPCPDPQDLSALVAAGLELGDDAVPFVLIGAGPMGAASRTFGSGLPSAWYIGRPSIQSNVYPGQPLVAQLRREAATG